MPTDVRILNHLCNMKSKFYLFKKRINMWTLKKILLLCVCFVCFSDNKSIRLVLSFRNAG